MVERYRSQQQLGRVDTRTGAPQAFRRLGDKIAQWQGEQGAFVQQVVTQKMAEHRKSILDGYEASLNRDLREGLTRIAAENPNNHAAYKEKAGAFVDSTLGQVDEKYRERFVDKSYALMDTYGNRILAENIKKDRQNTVQNLNTNIEIARDNAYRLAFDGSEQAITESAQAFIEADKSLNSLVEMGEINQADADRVKREMAKGMAEENFIGKVDSALEVSLDQGKAELERLDSMDTPQGWIPQEWESTKNRARQMVSRKESEIKAKLKVDITNLRNDVNAYVEGKSLGYDVSKDEQRLRSAAWAADRPEFIEAINQANELAIYSLQDSASRDAIQAAAQDGTVEGYQNWKRLSAQNAMIKQMYQQDGIAMGVRQGFIKPVALNEPDAFNIRDRQAQELSEMQGVYVSPFTQQEIASMVNDIQAGTVEQNKALISRIQTMSEPSRMAVYEKLAGKKQYIFATVGAIGDPNLINDALLGRDMLDAGVAKKPSSADYLSTFYEEVGDVYGAEDSQANLDTALAIYAYRYPGEVFNNSDFKEIIEEVTGGIGTYNGFKYQQPRGIGENVFEDYLENISEEGYQAMGGAFGYTYQQFMETLEDARLKSIGDNQYVVIDPKVGGALKQPDGRDFVLTYDLEYYAKKQRPGRKRMR